MNIVITIYRCEECKALEVCTYPVGYDKACYGNTHIGFIRKSSRSENSILENDLHSSHDKVIAEKKYFVMSDEMGNVIQDAKW